jgi:hypothetical protein
MDVIPGTSRPAVSAPQTTPRPADQTQPAPVMQASLACWELAIVER